MNSYLEKFAEAAQLMLPPGKSSKLKSVLQAIASHVGRNKKKYLAGAGALGLAGVGGILASRRKKNG